MEAFSLCQFNRQAKTFKHTRNIKAAHQKFKMPTLGFLVFPMHTLIQFFFSGPSVYPDRFAMIYVNAIRGGAKFL